MSKRIENEFVELITKNNIRIIDRYTLQLEIDTAIKTFDSINGDEYHKYLCESPIIVALVYGDNAMKICKESKYYIRNKHGCSNSMRNLLHTTDNPYEYKIQFDKFFDNLSYSKYQLEADLHIPWSLNHVNKIFTQYNIASYGIVIEQENIIKKLRQIKSVILNFDNIKDVYVGIRIKIKYKGIELYCIAFYTFTQSYKVCYHIKFYNIYQLIQWGHDNGGVIIVDYLPISTYNNDFVKDLQKLGIDGFKIYDIRYSYSDISYLMYLVKYKNKMICTGGSSDIKNSTMLSIDKEGFNMFKRGFKKYEKK